MWGVFYYLYKHFHGKSGFIVGKNDKENSIHQNLWDTHKTVLMAAFVTLNHTIIMY